MREEKRRAKIPGRKPGTQFSALVVVAEGAVSDSPFLFIPIYFVEGKVTNVGLNPKDPALQLAGVSFPGHGEDITEHPDTRPCARQVGEAALQCSLPAPSPSSALLHLRSKRVQNTSARKVSEQGRNSLSWRQGANVFLIHFPRDVWLKNREISCNKKKKKTD